MGIVLGIAIDLLIYYLDAVNSLFLLRLLPPPPLFPMPFQITYYLDLDCASQASISF